MSLVARWLLPSLLAGALTGGCAAKLVTLTDESGKPVRYAGRYSSAPVKIPASYAEKAVEFRGMWVTTAYNLDFPVSSDVATFQKNYLTILSRLRAAHFNAIIFQVRPHNDAFYRSRYNPWSRYLSGVEGRGLPNGFDPLSFMIAEAHRHGLAFHAWLNPFRVGSVAAGQSKSAYLSTLAPGNFARRHPNLVLELRNSNGSRQLLLDPGEPTVRSFVLATVMELAERYPIDAIHFDDYFYPNRIRDEDRRSFSTQNPRRLSRADWRRENINGVIRDIHDHLAAFNAKNRRAVEFGVSPVGIWGNVKDRAGGTPTAGQESFSEQFADTRKWVKSGWLDYIAPQLYWNFDHEVAAYAAVCDWWAATVRGTPVRLYIGHALHRLGMDRGWRDVNELFHQLCYNQRHSEIVGSVFFSYRNLVNPGNAVMRVGGVEMLRKVWTRNAALPR